jgi:hypothetical protein
MAAVSAKSHSQRMLGTDGFDPRCRDAFLHAALRGRCESTRFASDEDNSLSDSVRADVAVLGSDNARCVLGVPHVPWCFTISITDVR